MHHPESVGSGTTSVTDVASSSVVLVGMWMHMEGVIAMQGGRTQAPRDCLMGYTSLSIVLGIPMTVRA